MKKGRSDFFGAPIVSLEGERLTRNERKIFGKDGGESALFVLIVKKHDGNDTQLPFAGMARRHFALQVLEKTVGKTIESSFAPCVLLVASAAVGTNEFDGVLLRIAVQSRPTGATNPQSFGMLPVHWIGPPGIYVPEPWMREKGESIADL
jgi:hypothetical protein